MRDFNAHPLRAALEEALKRHGVPEALNLPAWVLSRYLTDALNTVAVFNSTAAYSTKLKKRGSRRD